MMTLEEAAARRTAHRRKWRFERMAIGENFIAEPEQQRSIINCAKRRGYRVRTEKVGRHLFVTMAAIPPARADRPAPAPQRPAAGAAPPAARAPAR